MDYAARRVRRRRLATAACIALASMVPVATAPGATARAAGEGCPSGPVAFTFDDGPVPGRTDRVLDVLASYQVRATFFVNGHNFDRDPKVVQRIAAEGHVIANHTWGHTQLARAADATIRREVLRNVESAEAAGVTMVPLVRPPGGSTSARVEAVLRDLGMTQVMWTVDPQDWRGHSASTLVGHVLPRLYSGANVLFHDASPASQVAQALPAILTAMAERGFCPGLFDADGVVVPAAHLEPVPVDPGPACVGPAPCDTLGFVDAAARWQVFDGFAPGAEAHTFTFGNPGDRPLAGDWDCDGVETPGVYRPSTGQVHLRNSLSPGTADLSFTFGDPGDVLLAGDWDGDGCDTLAAYRRSEARMYVTDRLGAGSAETVFTFGDPGDVPFVGDFDGDGRTDLALHRPTTGLIAWRLEQRAGPADGGFTYGNPGDRVVAGDWDGDGIDTPAAYRPSTGVWYAKLTNTGGAADHTVRLAAPAAVTFVVGAFGLPPG